MGCSGFLNTLCDFRKSRLGFEYAYVFHFNFLVD